MRLITLMMNENKRLMELGHAHMNEAEMRFIVGGVHGEATLTKFDQFIAERRQQATEERRRTFWCDRCHDLTACKSADKCLGKDTECHSTNALNVTPSTTPR